MEEKGSLEKFDSNRGTFKRRVQMSSRLDDDGWLIKKKSSAFMKNVIIFGQARWVDASREERAVEGRTILKFGAWVDGSREERAVEGRSILKFGAWVDGCREERAVEGRSIFKFGAWVDASREEREQSKGVASLSLVRMR